MPDYYYALHDTIRLPDARTLTMISTREQEPFATTEDVAEYLSKPASWVHNNAARLGLPRYRMGNQYRYRLSEIAAWVEQNGR